MNPVYRQTIYKGDPLAFVVTINDDDPAADYSGAELYLLLRHGDCEFTFAVSPVVLGGPGVPQDAMIHVQPTDTADFPCGLLMGELRLYRDTPAIGPLTIATVEIVVKESKTQIP